MKTRSIKQLLQLLLDNQHLFNTGICGWNTRLYACYGDITQSEWVKLTKFLDVNLPPRKCGVSGMYSWPPFKIEPRIAWIQEQIKLLS